MPAPSYLAKDRHGGYLFRIKIPTDLLEAFDGTRILVKSLQTHHRPTALKLARRLAVISQEVFDQIKMSEKPLKHQLAFAKARLSIKRDQLDDINSGRVAVSDGKIRYTEISMTSHQLETLGDENLELIFHEQSRIEQKITGLRQLVSDLEFQLDHVNKIKLQRKAEEIEGITPRSTPEQATQVAELLSKIEELQRSTAPASQLAELLHKVEALQLSISRVNEVPDSALISELWEDYRRFKIATKKWTTAKIILSYDSQIRDFIEIIGGDIPASQVDNNVALKTIEGLAKFPKSRGRKHKKILKLADIPESEERISTSTQSQRIDTLNSFFKYLAEQEAISRNPFRQYAMDRDPKNYATPSTTDIKEWFNLPEHLIKNAWQFWIPRLALFCGSRMGEIAQLTPEDIKQDPDTGIHYMLVTDEDEKAVKTEAGKRRVPIHQTLIDHGFLEYCNLTKTKGATSLWPNLNTRGNSLTANITDYWANLRKKHNVLSQPTNEFGQKKVFHSLRRVILNQLCSDGVDIITIQSIVGHEPSLGSSKTYIDRKNIRPLSITNPALQKLKVEGVNWEHPKKFAIA